MPKVAKEQHRYDWAVMGDAYFELALIGCQKICPQLSEFASGKIGLQCGDHSPEELIRPIVYNLRHAVEIYLKHFCIELLGRKYREVHDYNCLKGALLTGIDDDQDIKGLLLVADKYALGNYASMSLGLLDPHNTRERYPNDCFGDGWTTEVSQGDCQDIEKDIKKLQELLSKVGIQILRQSVKES